MHRRWKPFVGKVLVGILLVVTCPIWWAAIAAVLVVGLVVGTLHALGEGVLTTAMPLIKRMRSRS